MNFVSQQAQEAILNPNLPKSYKEAALEAAIEALLRIAEKRNAYNASEKDSRVETFPNDLHYKVKKGIDIA
jgi:hypothetical protein